MPLQFEYASEISAAPFAQAYAVINRISMNFPKDEPPHLEVEISIWFDKGAYNANKRPLRTLAVTSTQQQYNNFIQACVNGANPVNIVVNFLKNHSRFQGAVEVA